MATGTRKINNKEEGKTRPSTAFIVLEVMVCLLVIYVIDFSPLTGVLYTRADDSMKATTTAAALPAVATPAVLDKVAYDKKLLLNANYSVSTSSATSTATSTMAKRLWPAKAPYPLPGALLPYHRIIAYYGNFYSKGMGVLGQYPTAEMIQKLQAEVNKWNAADPATPAIPAIDYIAVTAQGSPGADGKYRFRMPDSQLDHAVELANQVHGIVVLDVQVGLSTVQTEVPLLDKYLSMPNVHLALDPEFDMPGSAKPGSIIGTMSASEINWAANHLAQLVRQNNLPPKVLIVHRFTDHMVTNTNSITPLPEVQVVMDMDGWGPPAKKIGTYTNFIKPFPVQFTGFKLFYKNDLKTPSTRILTPGELLKLTPQPLFIQFQ